MLISSYLPKFSVKVDKVNDFYVETSGPRSTHITHQVNQPLKSEGDKDPKHCRTPLRLEIRK